MADQPAAVPPMKRILVAFPVDMLADIDGDRGTTNRSEWIRQAAADRLNGTAALRDPGTNTVTGRRTRHDRREVEPRLTDRQMK